ncbi:MAG: hypothetical protein AAF685_13210 [Cyanobacteria bacterium P01_C01_bin.89]
MARKGFVAKALVGSSLAMGLVLGAIAPASAQRVTEPNRSNRDRSDRGPVSEQVEVTTPPTILEATDEAFFNRDKDYASNRTLGRTLAWIFGLGFPENEIVSDSRSMNELYVDLMRQQTTSDPTIRTQDLPNPYNTSIMELRNSGAGL